MQPLVMFLMIIPFPAIGFMVAVATGREGLMTPLGYLRWFRALEWGPSTDDSSSSDWGSSSYDDGGAARLPRLSSIPSAAAEFSVDMRITSTSENPIARKRDSISVML